MKAAVIQLNCQENLVANLAKAKALVLEAGASGANFIALPENFAFMGDEAGKRDIAESLDEQGPIVSALREMAKASGAFILGGGMPEKSLDHDRPFNTSVLVSPSGEIVSRYRKIHLFDIDLPDGSQSYRESQATSAGELPVVTEILGTKIGLSICYDLRFPELFRQLTTQGARIITVPAAFTLMTGKDHWLPLLRARAIENQVFVVAPAQQGKHPGNRQTYGKSLIIDAWGDVIAQCSDGEGLAIARIDRAAQDRVRASLPCLSHRRLT